MANQASREVTDRNGMTDPLVVSTKALSDALMLWVTEHRADHPNISPTGPGFVDWGPSGWQGRQPTFPVGAAPWLADETGISIRRVEGVLRCETKVTTLGLADALIVAIARPDLMPRVVPNPRWNRERWQSYMAERGCSEWTE